jgi:Leucine-rich repeat (LRR) protein
MNILNEISKEIGLLTNLIVLNFSNNQLTDLPIELNNLVNLNSICYDNIFTTSPIIIEITNRIIL